MFQKITEERKCSTRFVIALPESRSPPPELHPTEQFVVQRAPLHVKPRLRYRISPGRTCNVLVLFFSMLPRTDTKQLDTFPDPIRLADGRVRGREVEMMTSDHTQ